jgi:DNA-binding MarR family transcriptional regulator
MTMPSDGKRRVAAVRRFNRFYTRQIGVLRKTFLDSPYSLAEARVLYEIASSIAPTASAIGRTLDLDAGYLSRVLRNFEKRGLIQRLRRATRCHLALSARGRKSRAARPGARTHESDAARARPAEQVRSRPWSIETLLGGEAAPPPLPARRYRLRAPYAGDFGYRQTQRRLYAQEYGWMSPFEGVCAQIVADFANGHDPKRERCWIAELDGENVATVMLVKDKRGVARLRLLLVDPKARGLGSARGSSMNASASPAAPATKRSRYGLTAC